MFNEIFKYEYCQGLGAVLDGILKFIPRVAKFFKPVVVIGAKTFFKAGSEAIKKVSQYKT